MTQCRIILLLQPITKLYLFTIELQLRYDFRSNMCFLTFSTVPRTEQPYRPTVYIHHVFACCIGRKGFEMAFDLFGGKMKTGCQAILVFVTDGKDTDGEGVRCGPGIPSLRESTLIRP